MPTYQMTVEYDGTDWHGWQIQPNHSTIQGELESALRIVSRSDVSVVGSGRTDAGVHARAQIAHFKLDNSTDCARLSNSLNGVLPASIAVRHIKNVPESFHARFDANSRAYSYTVQTIHSALERRRSWYIRPVPDIEMMNHAARLLIRSDDYSAFCLTASETRNRVCDIRRAEWTPGLAEGSWVFRIEANRFLHGMVRAIVGTLVEIGLGKRAPESLRATIKSRDRREAGVAAPAKGLVLERVGYPLSG